MDVQYSNANDKMINGYGSAMGSQNQSNNGNAQSQNQSNFVSASGHGHSSQSQGAGGLGMQSVPSVVPSVQNSQSDSHPVQNSQSLNAPAPAANERP